ncbi:uncharacterized protein BO80DRAFT_427291 [Aspergillus ibericus CBS 121593]|uniref:Uncharacterized protein n=1 Tax=Aspergillus ibericus CBS 121593 TaxID=1448316 RepID=A0A395GUU3_9EURO|nr:hypothetical protein BO80DRAFT_427291 [Aspergillus ibericus CBS 121593]RAK98447.1 hypothetical protein BO80DRAFT_427291 [Aspergillus ibericus CBS 121593]
MDQFLLLRVIWKIHRGSELLKYLDLTQWLPDAKAKLDNLPSWKKYCNSFTTQIPEGSFALARHYQLQVSRTEQDDFGGSGVLFTPKVHNTRSRQQAPQPPVPQPDFTKTPPSKPDSEFATPHFDDDGDSDSHMSSPLLPSAWSSWSPIKADEEFMYPPTKDEQIVNTALLVFLDSLTLHFNLSVGWSLHRMALTAEFTDVKFQARTDGYLADRSGDIKAIIEVKPVLRQRKEAQIHIQESHQIVASLLDDYKSPILQRRGKPRLIISQDRQQIYISLAEYNDDYITYLQTGGVHNNPFLVMHQFGPWDTNNSSAMAELGPILLALTLKAQYY